MIYQGRVLLEGHTLQEADLQPNDTVIAVIPSLDKEDKEEGPVPDGDGECVVTRTMSLIAQ